MVISAISSSFPKSVNFGAHYTNVDVGASSILGSLKICAIDENNNVIAKERMTVFDEGERRSEDRFEDNVARKVADFEKRHKREIVAHDKDDEVKLTVCYPGPGVKTGKSNMGFLMSNFYYDQHRRERFVRPINPAIIDKGLRAYDIDVIQSRHANDMAGAGACLLSKLQEQHPQVLEEGEEILYMYPGGGLGTGMIIVDKDNIKVRPSEIQHIIKYGTNKEATEKDVGASGLRKNFSEALKLDGKGIGENTKAVTDYDEFIDTIGYHIDKSEFDEASKEAILKFMDSLAQLIATKVCESNLRTVVLTGPIVNGIRQSLNANRTFNNYTDPQEPDNFKATLKRKVQKNLSEVGNKLLVNPNKLNIIFLKIADNTDGAHLLHKGVSVGNPAVWYNIQK